MKNDPLSYTVRFMTLFNITGSVNKRTDHLMIVSDYLSLETSATLEVSQGCR